MAKVTWPLSSGEARGRVGDLIYNSHRGQSYVKAYALHQSEDSSGQIGSRGITAACTLAWQALTPDQAAVWNHFATEHLLPNWTGQPKRISGYNWFVKLNWFQQSINGTTSAIPPTSLADYLFHDLDYIRTPGLVNFTWTAQNLPDDYGPLVIGCVEGPWKSARQPNIKRCGTIRTGYESGGAISFPFTSTGWYSVFLWFQDQYAGSMPPQVFSFEVT